MYEFLTKRGEMLAFGLGAVLVLIFLGTVLPGLDEFNSLPEETRDQSNLFNIGLYLALILAVITVVAALAFGLWQGISNPKGSIKVVAGLGAIAVLFGIFYATSEAETTGGVYESAQEFMVSDNASKMISAAIKTGITMTLGSVVAFILAEVYNAFK